MDIRIGNTIILKVSPATIGETNFDNIKSIKAVFIRKENEQPQSCNPAPYCSRNNIYPCYNVQPYNACYCNNTCECCSEQAEYESELEHNDLTFTDGFIHFTFPANKQSHCGEYTVKLSAVIGDENTDEEDCLGLCMNTGIEFNLTCGGSISHGVGKSYTFTLGEGNSSTEPDDPVTPPSSTKKIYVGLGGETLSTVNDITSLTNVITKEVNSLAESNDWSLPLSVGKYIWVCSELPVTTIVPDHFAYMPMTNKGTIGTYNCYRANNKVIKSDVVDEGTIQILTLQ